MLEFICSLIPTRKSFPRPAQNSLKDHPAAIRLHSMDCSIYKNRSVAVVCLGTEILGFLVLLLEVAAWFTGTSYGGEVV